MGAADILSLAESAGVTVDVVDGRLRCLGPVSPELRGSLRAHKTQILELLAPQPKPNPRSAPACRSAAEFAVREVARRWDELVKLIGEDAAYSMTPEEALTRLEAGQCVGVLCQSISENQEDGGWVASGQVGKVGVPSSVSASGSMPTG